MSAYLEESDDLAVKVVSVFPENPNKNEPLIYAMVLVLDCSSGKPLALLEGGTLTAPGADGVDVRARLERLAGKDGRLAGGRGTNDVGTLNGRVGIRHHLDRRGDRAFALHSAGEGNELVVQVTINADLANFPHSANCFQLCLSLILRRCPNQGQRADN